MTKSEDADTTDKQNRLKTNTKIIKEDIYFLFTLLKAITDLWSQRNNGRNCLT